MGKLLDLPAVQRHCGGRLLPEERGAGGDLYFFEGNRQGRELEGHLDGATLFHGHRAHDLPCKTGAARFQTVAAHRHIGEHETAVGIGCGCLAADHERHRGGCHRQALLIHHPSLDSS